MIGLEKEPDPHDLMQPFPAEPMRRWPVSLLAFTNLRTTTPADLTRSSAQVRIKMLPGESNGVMGPEAVSGKCAPKHFPK